MSAPQPPAPLVLVALAALFGAAPALAQSPGRSVSVLVSRSLSSATAAAPSLPCGCAAPRDVLAAVSISSLELSLSLPLRAGPRWGLDYTARLVPLAQVTGNPTDAARREPAGWAMPLDTPRGSTLGVGAKPMGVRWWLGSEALRLESEVSAGALYFGSPVLASNANRLNFVYEIGIGVRIGMWRGGQALLGLRRHHLSNAGLAEVNPGLNSHAAYVGLAFRGMP